MSVLFLWLLGVDHGTLATLFCIRTCSTYYISPLMKNKMMPSFLEVSAASFPLFTLKIKKLHALMMQEKQDSGA